MISFDRFKLENGLTVLVHEDKNTPMAVMNILYKVGARNEEPERTGFAHLFEHLMFGGSKHIPVFDAPLQQAGGENNAFTNNDLTNYYDVLPAHNLETGFWLESDRMMNLNIDANSLEVQRKVVIEEFKENYINQPYGNVWHLLCDLSYKVHPYRWPTIGLNLKHIEEATLEDVRAFFERHYSPNNAIMVVAGNVDLEQVKALSEKYFGEINRTDFPKQEIPKEPKQVAARTKTIHSDVPVNALYKTFHMDSRAGSGYYKADIISDILSGGHSSRLHQSLVKEQKLFSNIDAYISGFLDDGLMIIDAKLNPGVDIHKAEEAVDKELSKISTELVEERELTKVKNKIEASFTFSEVSLLNRAMSLAYFEMLGDAGMVNNDIDRYLDLNAVEIRDYAKSMFDKNNSNTLYYLAN